MQSTRTPADLNFPRPLVTVDVVIFTVLDDALKLVLVRRPDDPGDPFPGRWALPGGFIDVEEDASLLGCAARKLQEKTGVSAPYLCLLYTSPSPRDGLLSRMPSSA